MNKTINVSDNVNKLDINLHFGELVFETGEEFSVYVDSNEENDFVIEENDCTLYIKDDRQKQHFHFNDKEDRTTIKITVPENVHFEKINFTTGAAELCADAIKTDHFLVKMGAGQFLIKDLQVNTMANIEGGAGEINVENGAIHNLDMSFGAGKATIQAAITGSSMISTGVGKLNLTLLGNAEDYSATVSSGLGKCCINGLSSGYGSRYGSGPNHIRISGGVGSINVTLS